MGTSATISIRRGARYTNILVGNDGYPSHMLKALENVTDEQLLAFSEIRFIDVDDTIETYADPQPAPVTLSPERGMTSSPYARGESGKFELV